ncbi:uncharacterized protein LOC144175883 [Haemaphysalis longicornis]
MKARIEDRIVYSPFPEVEVPCCSFYQAAKKALLNDPWKPALADKFILLTRGELLVRIQRYAAGLQRHGVQPRDRVCVHTEDTVENFVALWGCVFAGASIVLAKTSLTERELHHRMSDSDCTHILTDLKFAEKAARAASPLKLKGQFATGPSKGFIATNDFVNIHEATFREILIEDPRDYVLAICYTSGTTGQPKGVVATHYGFLANMATAWPLFPKHESGGTLISAPMMHSSGLVTTTMAVLLGGLVVMMSPKADVHHFAELVRKYKVRTVRLLPTALKSLAAEMRRLGIRLPSIRRVGVGGDSLSEAACSEILSVFDGADCMMNVYAMTEAMAIVCSPSMHSGRGTDVGFPVPSAQIKVVDQETGHRLGANQTGEICFRIPTIMKEYYQRPKETADVFDEESWCKSGDAGYYDDDGRLHIVQRLKEMIKCMDQQVLPAEIENLLLEEHLEEISEVAVAGLPHPHYGQSPAAAVVLRSQPRGQDTRSLADLAKKMKSILDEKMPAHKRLYGGVFFFDSLPKTDTMKVNRPALVQACLSKPAF